MAVQLNFTLRTSSTCKTVHLLGNWDNYTGQLPLSRDPSKTGGWKGCFRFQGKTLKPGQRYWYYYIIDGYHVSHDPARESVVEPTTQRRLNILDIPATKTASDAATGPTSRSQHGRRVSQAHIPKGRSLSPSKIQSPQPTKPHATLQITTESFSNATVDALTAKFSRLPVHEDSDSDSDSDSDVDSDLPSLTGSSRSSNNSSPSSVSSVSSTASACSCERYGITRRGDRVKLDCGGARCGYSDSEECSESEDEGLHRFASRRHGLIVH